VSTLRYAEGPERGARENGFRTERGGAHTAASSRVEYAIVIRLDNDECGAIDTPYASSLTILARACTVSHVAPRAGIRVEGLGHTEGRMRRMAMASVLAAWPAKNGSAVL
jgi:hypothetical protein